MIVGAKTPPPPPTKIPPHQATYLLKEGEEGGATFLKDSSLPSLPLPPLHDTLDLYLTSVQPHVTSQEYEVTKHKVNAFATGIGPKLHRLLQQRQTERKNWLEDWWLHSAYLTYRDPILPNLNTSGLSPLNLSIWKPSVEKGLEFGSLFLWSLLQFHQMLREERYKPHTTRDGKALSMDQFRWVFGCTRLPGRNVDSLKAAWQTKAEGDCPNYITVLCKGHIWLMYPWNKEGVPLPPPELEVQIKHVWNMSEQMGRGEGIAAMTCDKRPAWAENREWLKSLSLGNMRNLELIESSSFVLVLDENCPANMDEMVWEALCGNAENRWADKSTSAIIMRNGYIATNNDHTPYDAMVSVATAHYQQLLIEHLQETKSAHKTTENRSHEGQITSPPPPPQPLTFDLDGKLRAAIQDAKRVNRMQTSKLHARTLFFDEYGKDFLRPHKLHPDSYVQMALQLTYYTLHGRPAPTYETASTRQFYHGRTETVRSCTMEAINWAKTMLNPSSSLSERRTKLIAAIEKHNELRDRCEKGLGADRHLLGLYLIAVQEGEEIPTIFTDPAFYKSGGGGNFSLSTSTVGYTSAFGGVAPMTKDGYGCFYAINNNRLIFFVSHFVSSPESDGEKFIQELVQSLRKMKLLFMAPKSNL